MKMLSKLIIVAAVLSCALQQASCFLRSPPPMKLSRTIATPNALGLDDFAVTLQVPRNIFNLFTQGFNFSGVKYSMANVLFQLGFIESTSAAIPISWALPILGFGFLAMFLHATKGDKFKHPYVEGAAVYCPVVADKFYRSHPRLVAARVFKILRLALGFNVRLLRDWRFDLMKENQEARADELVDLLTQMGPTYIKLGQALSIRTDIVPPVYANSLKRLQDAVPAFPTKLARQIICSELGISELSEVFDEFSTEAVAAASIGQVYRATLKDGREVAVKVQRPNVLPSIGLDLYVMRKLAPIQTVVSNKLSGMTTEPADVELAYSLVDEWGKGLVAEVDYLLEAENTIQFSKAMLSRGLNAVISPEVVEELCTQKIMVTQWITGTRLDRDCSADVPRLCGLAVNAYLTMLLDTGVLHCDPHPGNLLRTEDGRLCVLDWGMTLTLPQDLQYSLLEFIAHCNSEDYSHLGKRVL
jgi:predicted unusual protein kinase regulating ubiquinone biosynthesis (AarF/ABC1/UbiB family)